MCENQLGGEYWNRGKPTIGRISCNSSVDGVHTLTIPVEIVVSLAPVAAAELPLLFLLLSC